VAEHGLTALAAILIWYFSTGIILVLGGLPRPTHRWTMIGLTALLPVALYGIHISAPNTTATGAYVAFSSSVFVWAWIEASFLLGYVTGPRRTSSPTGIEGWSRFWVSTQTVIHHELLIVAGGLMIAVAAWEGSNSTAILTFVILAIMRLSAKLNIFLGVPYINDELLPAHLEYLGSYFRRRSFNALFPVSIGGGVIAAAVLVQSAVAAEQRGASSVGFVLMFTMMVLAVIEHLFMVLPFRDAALWRWAKQNAGTKGRDG
jgi:putative photosynthetic complex assembly protein 2